MRLPDPVPALSSLDLLITLAQTTSLRQAAAVHGISQPAASQRLQALERTLGLHLIDRGPNGSRLTPDGAAVVEWATDVVQSTRTLLIGAQALRAQESEELQVAASMTIAEHLMPNWLVQLRTQRPGAHVSLIVGNSEQITTSVRRGDVGLGFVEGPSAPRDLRWRKVGGDTLTVVVSPEHPWARRRDIVLTDLAAVPLLTREHGSGTREALDTLLAPLPDRVDPALELASTSAILAAAATGVGPAVLSQLAAERELTTGRLVAVPLRNASLDRTFRAVWRPDHKPEGLGARLVALAAATVPTAKAAGT